MELINKINGEVVGSAYRKINWVVYRKDLAKDKDFIDYENKRMRYAIMDSMNKMIGRMSSGMHPRENRPILISLNVLGPISKEQTIKLNDNRDTFSAKLGGAVGTSAGVVIKLFGGVAGSVAGTMLGAGLSYYVTNKIRESLPYSNAEDLIIVVEAVVSGGIGQQHAIDSTTISREYYDPI